MEIFRLTNIWISWYEILADSLTPNLGNATSISYGLGHCRHRTFGIVTVGRSSECIACCFECIPIFSLFIERYAHLLTDPFYSPFCSFVLFVSCLAHRLQGTP